MKRKLLIVVGVALVAATVSTVVFYQLISDSLLADGASHKTEEYPVVTAARDLPRGTRLAAEDLKVTSLGGEKPSGAFAQPTELTGRLVDRDLRQGEPIFDSGLIAPGQSGGAGAIPPGMRAVSIHLAEYAGVAKMLENGDRVDVLAADSERRPGNLGARVHTVLQGVAVLDTGKDEDPRRAAPPVVTLLVEAKDAELLSLADQAGAIRFALRNPLDGDTTEEGRGAGWHDVISKRPGPGGRERADSSTVRNISQAKPAAKPQPARSQEGSELAAVMPDLHSRRPDENTATASTATASTADVNTATENTATVNTGTGQIPAEANGVLLAITFAGLGDEALAELTSGLDQRYAGSPLILSAFQPDWDVPTRVRALQQAQRLEVFADPSVLAIERTEAHFERTSDAAGAVSLNGERGAPQAGCSDRVGVRVSFVPTIGADKRLRIRVTSKVAVPDPGQTPTGGDCLTPLVAMRQWSGEIEIADGQSFWVRGLIDRPGAWDFLRRLFPQRRLEYDRNDELAILVTPKLVGADKRGKPLSAAMPR
jgi:pilus assembly protein CpaB